MKQQIHPGRIVLDYLASLEDAWMMVRVPSATMPFAVFAALQCVVLVALGMFPLPPMSSVVVPVIERLGGEAALHYPMHFILLPNLFHTIYVALFVLPGFLLFGGGVAAMSEYIGRRDRVAIPKRRGFFATAPAILTIGVIYTLCATGIPAAFATLSATIPNAKAAQLTSLCGIVFSVIVQALLVYALVFLRTRETNPFAAFHQSVNFARGHFAVTVLLVASVVAVHAPIDFLLAHADGLAIKFRPELVLYVLLLGVVVELVTTYALFAATTAIALSRREVGIR